MYLARLHLFSQIPRVWGWPKMHMYFSLLTHAKKLLLVTFCDTTAGITNVTGLDADNDNNARRTDMNVEIAMLITTIYWWNSEIKFALPIASCKTSLNLCKSDVIAILFVTLVSWSAVWPILVRLSRWGFLS